MPAGRKQRFFWVSAVVLWALVSLIVVEYGIEPVLIENITDFLKKPKLVQVLVKVLGVLVTTFFGTAATAGFRNLIRQNLADVHDGLMKSPEFQNMTTESLKRANVQLLKEMRLPEQIQNGLRITHTALLGELSHNCDDSAFFAYQRLVNDGTALKALVGRLAGMPRDPAVVRELIEAYSSKAAQSLFLVDFKTFLRLATILVRGAQQMQFVNKTPPYEWFFPLPSDRSEEVKGAILEYQGAIELEMQRDTTTLHRISIVDDRSALTSVLKHGVTTYLTRLSIDSPSSTQIGDEVAKPIMCWLHDILLSYESGIEATSKEDSAVAAKLRELLAGTTPVSPQDRYRKFVSDYLEQDRGQTAEGKLGPGSGLADAFTRLSEKVSVLIQKDFVKLSKPEEQGFYVIKNLIGESGMAKIIAGDLDKEEGVIADQNGNRFLIRMEESNGMNVLLAKVRTLSGSPPEETVYPRLLERIVKKRYGGTGMIKDLVPPEEVPAGK